MQPVAKTLPLSKHFRLRAIADGVYVALASAEGAAFSNAAVVDLGDRALIFDTFETHFAAQDLRNAAERLTGRPATYVVNSHAHPDHWFGNQVFADHAAIIATHNARTEMATFAADLKAEKEDRSELEAMLGEQRRRLEAETDERRRATLKRSVVRWEYTLAALPTFEVCFPSLTFDGKMVFHGTQRTVELVALNSGHTSGDCYLLLPAEKIVLMGDLGFFQRQPFMADCDPEAWVAQLERFEQSDFETFVPGHGPVGAKADIVLQREYLTTLEAMVAQAIREGKSLEATQAGRLPAPFDAWSDDGTPLGINVQVIYERLCG
jgi:glyoxylase-like metal-dependent hydrolase (beta-lactamase superfamily II)